MPQSMEVEIRIYVDATGAVIGAKSLYENAQISRLAVNAVRRIRFIPARRGKDNVASDLIIKLRLATD
jgi:outer membrane biosynthesis protein TonB